MQKKQYDKLYIEGIKERLEDLIEDDIYFKYGRLIAIDIMTYSNDKIDYGKIVEYARKNLKSKKKDLSW